MVSPAVLIVGKNLTFDVLCTSRKSPQEHDFENVYEVAGFVFEVLEGSWVFSSTALMQEIAANLFSLHAL